MPHVSRAQRLAGGKIRYHGRVFPGFNKPRIANHSRYKEEVLAKKGNLFKLVRYGHRGYSHNYNPKAKRNYLRRSAGIRNKRGQLTRHDPWSANIVTGDAAQAMGTMGAVIPRVAAPEGAVKVEWDLSSLNAGASYAINLYPVAATVYTQAIKTVSFEGGDAHQFTVEPSDKRTGFSNLVLSGVTPGKYKVAVAQVNGTGALLLDVKFTVA